MNIETWRRLNRQVEDLHKSGIKFDVAISNDSSYIEEQSNATFTPIHCEITTLKQLSELQTILARPISQYQSGSKFNVTEFGKKLGCISPINDILYEIRSKPASRMLYPTLKFYSNVADYNVQLNIYMISEEPKEQIEDGVTYRYIGDDDTCHFCIPHTDPRYNFLDKGFFFIKVTTPTGKERVIVTNEMTVDTYLCFVMLAMSVNTVAKHLTNEHYLNANLAKLMRVKMEKDVPDHGYHNKRQYEQIRTDTLKEYERTANAGLFTKLLEGKIPSGSFNGIKLTKNSAKYENVELVADGLLESLSNLAFDDRTDIYVMVRHYIALKIMELDMHNFYYNPPFVSRDENGEPLVPAELEAQEAYIAAWQGTIEKTFQINGINITLKRVHSNSRRYVNDVAINKDEVETVCFRASCYDNQDIFDRFVNSVNEMSLKWHDALANGVGVKIHDSLTWDEYDKAEAPPSAPKLKFRKEGKIVNLVIDKENVVKVNFTKLLNEVRILNRRTNDGYSGYQRRNAEWCRNQLVGVLKECCTFDRKELIVDPETNEPMLDINGKKTYRKIPECLITDEQADFIQKMAREYYEKAIEKSKIFLETAIKATETKLEKFKGEDHYIVEGKHRKYAVKATTNEVFNYETGNYICIVEGGGGHNIMVGCDATAARLYALRNDSMTAAQIGTIR